MDKPHVISISLFENKFTIDYVFRGDRHIGNYTLDGLVNHVKHNFLVVAALDLAGVDPSLSLKERIAVFNLTGADR